ncbi:MAG: DUF2975 domain-containing protein [Pedobacter sp.]|uniref:DUF2975 domain-containing protein n=1 Tax=Pedobacter sp. JCM 36344 TaxID=3374280 RepID=UPI0019A59146|nr:DUF2975 domain-containing protein [Pedobacter sp.]
MRKSRRVIRVIKVILDVGWYFNIVLATIAGSMLFYEFAFNTYADWNTTVHIPQYDFSEKIDLNTDEVKDVILRTSTATLGLKIKNTLLVKSSSIFLLFAIECLIFSIIYHLRKLFSSLHKGVPFTFENVITLKRIAFFIALILPVQIILYLFELQILNANFSKPIKFSVDPVLNFEVLLIAIIFYIVAEIFNSGLELKKENEGFV